MGLMNYIKAKLNNSGFVQYLYNGSYGQPRWATTADEQYVREAYNKIVWVYSCVSLISNCTSSVKWCLYRKGKNIIEIEEHPILEMLNNRANPYLSSKDFFDIWATYLALQGKFYAVFNSPVYPSRIEFLYPHKVKPIPDIQNFVSGYEYSIEGKRNIYDENLTLWSKFIDPLDIYGSMSPIRAMARTIDTENESIDWNKSTLQNQAVPPGAFQVVNPSPQLRENLKSEWIKNYAGANNARIPLILNSEKATYVQFGLNPVDMDFIEQRKINRQEICSGFNVPSQLVGDVEGQTYANYEEARKAFWENTVLPKYIENIKGCLNSTLCKMYNDNLYIDVDYDKIQALQPNRAILVENTRNLWNDGLIRRAEARDELGYEVDEGDNVYIDEELKKSKLNNSADEKGLKKKTYY